MRRPPQKHYYRDLDAQFAEDYVATSLLTAHSTTLLDPTRPLEIPMELNTDDLDCRFYEDLLSEREVIH